MRLPAALFIGISLVGISLFAQQGKLIPPAQRVDVGKFLYTDYPNQNKTLKVADAKGKVVVFVFLKEGNIPAKKALGEVRWLQEQEAAMGMIVAPIYDVSSRGLMRTTAEAQAEPMPAGDGIAEDLFRNVPISFKIYQEFNDSSHLALFPKFEGQPATFVLDRQGRIATSLFGYQKGSLAKAVKAVLEEPQAAN